MTIRPACVTMFRDPGFFQVWLIWSSMESMYVSPEVWLDNGGAVKGGNHGLLGGGGAKPIIGPIRK